MVIKYLTANFLYRIRFRIINSRCSITKRFCSISYKMHNIIDFAHNLSPHYYNSVAKLKNKLVRSNIFMLNMHIRIQKLPICHKRLQVRGSFIYQNIARRNNIIISNYTIISITKPRNPPQNIFAERISARNTLSRTYECPNYLNEGTSEGEWLVSPRWGTLE